MPSGWARVLTRLRTDERGTTSVGILMAIGFTFIVAVMMVNLFLYLYGQGAARAAIDEGVRAGSRVDAGETVCEQRAKEALAGLMPGPLGDGVTVRCGVAAGELVAVADVTLDSPMPLFPSWSFQMEARATQEVGE